MVKHTENDNQATFATPPDEKHVDDTIEDVEQTGKEEYRDRVIVTEEDVSRNYSFYTRCFRRGIVADFEGSKTQAQDG